MGKSKRIKTKLEMTRDGELTGWYQGRQTYLRFAIQGECKGILSGPRLLRLAKAIVRHMEAKPCRP